MLRRKQSTVFRLVFKFHKNGQVAKLIKTVEGRVELYTAWREEGVDTILKGIKMERPRVFGPNGMMMVKRKLKECSWMVKRIFVDMV